MQSVSRLPFFDHRAAACAAGQSSTRQLLRRRSRHVQRCVILTAPAMRALKSSAAARAFARSRVHFRACVRPRRPRHPFFLRNATSRCAFLGRTNGFSQTLFKDDTHE
jgi:hypothetical protein